MVIDRVIPRRQSPKRTICPSCDRRPWPDCLRERHCTRTMLTFRARFRAVAKCVALGFTLFVAASGYCQQESAGTSRGSTVPTLAGKPAPAILVTNPSANSLSVFPAGSNGNVASLFTRTMLSQPYGVAYHAGNLYVANSGGYSVTVYPAGAGRRPNPLITISGGKTKLAVPRGIAVDSAGNIYVANNGVLGSEPASVTIYRAGDNGDAAPIARISGPRTRLEAPEGLALDSHGSIYVANESDSPKKPDTITVYSPGSNGDAAPVRVISGPATLLSQPGGIAVDPSGNLFVTSARREGQYSSAAVLIFAPGATGNAAPLASIEGDCARLTAAGGIALGSNGDVYVTNPDPDGSGGVLVFAQENHGPRVGPTEELRLKPILTYPPHASPTMIPPGDQCPAPIARIEGDRTRIGDASGIAVDPAGNMYVTDTETERINIFPAGADGNATPSVTMESPHGIVDSCAVAIDSHGQIFVANGGGEVEGRGGADYSVTVYPAGSYANVAPIAKLSGSISAQTGYDDKSGISAPQAIAVDAHGRIFIANGLGGYNGQGNITVYPAASDGDVRPIATIGGTRTGDHTGLNDPVGLAFDAVSNLYVLNNNGGPDNAGSITVYASDANGNVAPKAVIANDAKGGRTQFKSPAGLALDSAGNMYVTNQASSIGATPDCVTIYAAGKFGNVAPMAMIAGSHTGLNRPHGIGIDSDGKIYVSNDGSDGNGADAVTVYAPGSSGDAAPIATISGSLTGLVKPAGLAVGP